MADAPIPNANGTLTHIGSYRLLQSLGSGGMSSVFRAVHVESGHEVALKVLPRSLARHGTLLQRFLREARSAEALEHPNIVAIYDRGVEDGRYYLVLEYVSGGDLHDRVRERGTLPVDEACAVIRGVCEALRYAAGQGVIHRDIKPANILLTADGKPKLADLGLALQAEDEDERVTRDGTTVGTVDYMAPEQARDSRATSIRSDIYSLGCTFYHLLAGSAPFAGGDVTEKLRRHAFSPPPDVHQIRPDVPEHLARVIQKMMAKKPEQRYQDYDQLIAAIDSALKPPSAAGALYAVFDDEDDGPLPVPPGAMAPPPAAEPLYALIDDEADTPPRPPSVPGAVDAPLVALIDDEPAAPAPPRARRTTPSRTEPVPERPGRAGGRPEVNLADLAAIEDDAGQAAGRRPRSSRPTRLQTFNDDSDSLPVAVPRPAPSPRVTSQGDDDLRLWITRGLMIGVAIVLVGFGLFQLISLQLGWSDAGTEVSTEEAESASAADAGFGAGAGPTQSGLGTRTTTTPAAPPAAPWFEPSDPGPRIPSPEPGYLAALETIYRPDWSHNDPSPPGGVTLVRRLGSDPERSSLASALQTDSGTIELDDLGPLYEADLNLGNRSRRIRPRGVLRPIVVLSPPATSQAPSRPALVSLEGNDLILEGLDLVVPLSGMPPNVASFFQVGAGTLVLRDCTLTVDGPPTRRFSIVRLGEPGKPGDRKPPRVRFERCLVRGPSVTAVELAGRGGEVHADRSVFLSGAAPVIGVRPSAGAPQDDRPRRVSLVRSVAASQSAVIETAAGAGSAPLDVRALGSTFARIQGGSGGALLVCPAEKAATVEAGALLSWSGDYNQFIAFPAWLTAGDGSRVVVPNLAAAKRVWPGIEGHGREHYDAWPESVALGWSVATDLDPLASDARSTLARVAAPGPFLRARTLGSFERLPVPEPSRFTAEAAIRFDADAGPWNGDLGRFLAGQTQRAMKRLVVLVQGHGRKVLTPIRLPEGLSLEIRVEPGPEGSEPLVWMAGAQNLPGGSLLATKGADLSLYNVRIHTPGSGTAGLANLVRVEDGRLSLSYCELVSQDANALTGPLVVHRSATTRHLPAEPGILPKTPGADMPVARILNSTLIAGGIALQAELGRGVVALQNSALAGGTAAISLQPQAVGRARFQADLWLDRCTLTGRLNLIQFGPWPGAGEGPDRPWLISSRASAFLDAYRRAKSSRWGALLRVDPNALAQGAVVWQAEDDAYELSRFVALGTEPADFSIRPDVRASWINLWGTSHIRRVTGPTGSTPNPAPTVRLRSGPLHPGQVRPADLVLAGSPSVGAVLGPVPGPTTNGATANAQPGPAPRPPGRPGLPPTKAASPGTNRPF